MRDRIRRLGLRLAVKMYFTFAKWHLSIAEGWLDNAPNQSLFEMQAATLHYRIASSWHMMALLFATDG